MSLGPIRRAGLAADNRYVAGQLRPQTGLRSGDAADALFVRERRGFIVAIVATLFLPRIPLPVSTAQPVSSAVSLGFIGLIYWAISCRLHPRRRDLERARGHRHALILAVAMYQFVVTVLRMNLLSVLYSAQWLLYTVLAVWLLDGYYEMVVRLGRQRVLWFDLEVITVAYAVGLLVSLWAGPLYPWQVGWYERMEGSIRIVSAVGFGNGKNGAGATMMMLIPVMLFSPSHGIRKIAPALVALAGLAVTFSRGSLIGLFSGLATAFAVATTAFLAGKSRVSERRIVVVLASLLVCIVTVVAIGSAIIDGDVSSGYARAIISTTLPGPNSSLSRDLVIRFDVWRAALSRFADSNNSEFIFGHGFRGASSVESVYAGGPRAWSSPHSSYIEFVFDFGIVGGILMALWYLSTTVRSLWGMLQQSTSWQEANTVAGVAMTSFAVLNLSETYLYSVDLLVLMLVVAGLPLLTSSPSSVVCSGRPELMLTGAGS